MSETKEDVTFHESRSHYTMDLSVFLSLAQVSFVSHLNSSMPDERQHILLTLCTLQYFFMSNIFISNLVTIIFSVILAPDY